MKEYLTSGEFEAKYTPTEEDLAAVRGYFESEGFTITYAPRNRQFVSARATAAELLLGASSSVWDCRLIRDRPDSRARASCSVEKSNEAEFLSAELGGSAWPTWFAVEAFGLAKKLLSRLGELGNSRPFQKAN